MLGSNYLLCLFASRHTGLFLSVMDSPVRFHLYTSAELDYERECQHI